jgi:predicted  nucleic acid-binding Zn-ribbon protein
MEMALEDMKDLKALKNEIVDKKEELETLKDEIRKIDRKKKKK